MRKTTSASPRRISRQRFPARSTAPRSKKEGFPAAFCVIYFYLRKFLPAAKVVGVIVDSCLTLIAVACLATAIFLMIGGDISVLQHLWQTIFRW